MDKGFRSIVLAAFRGQLRSRLRSNLARRLMLEELETRRVFDAATTELTQNALASDGEERIVINDTSGNATAIALGSQHKPVVELFLGGGLCSGTLVDMTHIITAQHCTFGTSTGVMTVNFHSNNDGVEDFTRSVAAKFEVNSTNSLLDGTDVAILRLSSPAPAGFTPMRFGTTNPTGVQTRMVGFGRNGVGSTGHGGTRDGLRWGADNRIDAFGAARNPGGVALGGTANIFNTDFDNGTAAANTLSPGVTSSSTPLALEGTTAPGDSGGPLIASNQVVGVLSGGTTNSSGYGDISWWTGTTNHRAFIEANIPGAIFNNTIRLPSDGNANRMRITLDAGGTNLQFFLDADGPGAAVEKLVNFQPVSTLTSLVIQGSNQSDELVVDYANGNPIPSGGLTFNGSTGTSDKLRASGGSFTSITETFTSTSGGSVQLVQTGPVTRNISYTGLESVQLNVGSVSSLTFQLPNIQNDEFGGVEVGNDNGSVANHSEIRSPTFADTTFRNPTSSLTVNLGNVGDRLTMLAMDANFSANVVTTINGGSGPDIITGNSLANRLRGNGGNDVLTGGGGNDTYLFDTDTALGTDTLNEAGGGIDTLDFGGTTTRIVKVNLGNGASQVVNAGLTLVLASGTTFENVIGGSLGDNLTGNSLANTLTGAGGNDTLNASSGNDTYLFDTDSALGTDTLNEAGGGIDTLDFSGTTTRSIALNLALAGAQVVNAGLTLILGAGNTFEKAIGGALGDTITGNSLNNILLGGAGIDTLRGGTGRDVLIGGTGADTLLGESGDDLLISGTTTYDKNQSALLVILAEWSDVAKSYSVRVANLRAGIAGVRLLSAGVGATVLNDGLVDNLTGGTATDWFFAALADTVTDQSASESKDVLP